MMQLNTVGTDPTPELIAERVRQFQEAHADVYKDMDADHDLYDLKEYNANSDGTHTFPSYTSNSPRVYAKKVLSLLAASELFIKVPYGVALGPDRDRHDVKERFFYGLLNAADERLLRRLEKRVKTQIEWAAAVRGYICVRAVLGKDNNETYVDILPLDPRNASWGVGYDGLEWAAYTTTRTTEQINASYGANLGGAATTTHEVTDYYDRRVNAVSVQGYGFIKPPTPHGATRVPVIIVPVGFSKKRPGLATESFVYGTSIFAENRTVYTHRNQILSIYLSLVQKARDRSYVLYSPDGGTILKDNPNEAAGVIPLPSVSKLDLVPLPETTKDAAVLAQLVTEEMHFGSLSKTSYGDVPFQLSGFAINSLRQSVFSILEPVISAIQDTYELVLNALHDQYMTGAYDTLTLSGAGNDRAYFSSSITPQQIAGLPAPIVTLEPDLPQDDVGNLAMATQARTPDAHGVPLLPHSDVLERIVHVQDVGATMDAIKEEQAERGSARALAYTLMTAAENRGRDDLASIWFGDLLIQQLQQLIQLTLAKMQAAQVGAVPGAPPGLPPSILPNAARGKPPPRPTPQGGANVPENSPRPGAREIPAVIQAWNQ